MKRRSEKGSHSLHARACTCVGVRGLQEMQVCKIPLFFLQLYFLVSDYLAEK